jgi:hypothetical protein
MQHGSGTPTASGILVCSTTVSSVRDDELIAAITERFAVPTGDWVAAYRDGDALTTAEAGMVADCSAETVRRHAIEAAKAGNPLGICIAESVWLISLRRLLDHIEHRHDRHERLTAESRAKKVRDLRSARAYSTRFVALNTA